MFDVLRSLKRALKSIFFSKRTINWCCFASLRSNEAGGLTPSWCNNTHLHFDANRFSQWKKIFIRNTNIDGLMCRRHPWLTSSLSHCTIHCLSVSNLLHSPHTQAYQVLYHNPYQVSIKKKSVQIFQKWNQRKWLLNKCMCFCVCCVPSRLWAFGASSSSICDCSASVAGPDHRLL